MTNEEAFRNGAIVMRARIAMLLRDKGRARRVWQACDTSYCTLSWCARARVADEKKQ